MFFWKNLEGGHEVINMLSFFPFCRSRECAVLKLRLRGFVILCAWLYLKG